jgi:hypothetical protein
MFGQPTAEVFSLVFCEVCGCEGGAGAVGDALKPLANKGKDATKVALFMA